jgi:DNA modification methylase
LVRDRRSSLPSGQGRCRGVEFDPLYVDVIIRRYEAETGREAVPEAMSETFAELAVRRRDG